MGHCISWWLYHNACVVLLHARIVIRLTTSTVDTSVSSTTLACISVHSISACSAVHTWITVAFDYVYDIPLHIRCIKWIFNATRTNLYVADVIRWKILVIYNDNMTISFLHFSCLVFCVYWHHSNGIESFNFKYIQLKNDNKRVSEKWPQIVVIV